MKPKKVKEVAKKSDSLKPKIQLIEISEDKSKANVAARRSFALPGKLKINKIVVNNQSQD